MAKPQQADFHLFTPRVNMIKALLLSCLFLCQTVNAKIYDCFPFFNEIELLKLRFDELDDCVDYFVLVESIETQRGSPKQLFFEENKHLFNKYLSKIIHIVVDERHSEWNNWDREHYQRNCIMRGLNNCIASDVIIISDLDEIPRSTIVPQLADAIRRTKFSIFNLHQDIYFFQLNRQTPTRETWGGGHWCGTIILSYEMLAQKSPQFYRDRRGSFIWVNQGGWHFTWMGGKEAVRKKMLSVVEGSNEIVTDEQVEMMMNNHPPVPLDSSFPEYVLKNKDYLKSIGFLADGPGT